MFRKISLLLLAALLAISAISPAMSADYECTLRGDSAIGKYDEPTLHEDCNDNYEWHFGYSYLMKYRLPNLELFIHQAGEDDEDRWTKLQDFTVSWDLTFDTDNLKVKELTKDASSDIVVISGYLPDSADAYSYHFNVSAIVTNISEDRYKQYAIGTSVSFDAVEIEVTPDTEHTQPTSDDLARYLEYDSKDINIHEVGPDYLVTVTMSKDYDDILQSYSRYIRNFGDYMINIPEWLTYEITGTQTEFATEDLENEFAGNTAITSIVIKFNDKYEGKLLGDLQDGTTARVNVPLLSRDDFDASELLLNWNVTYRKPAPFTITSSKNLAFTLRPGSSDVARAEYTGPAPVRITSSDSPSGVSFVMSYTSPDETSGKGTITVTVSASSSASDGDYEKSYTFTDAYGNSDTLTAKVTVRKPVTPNPPDPDPTPVRTLSITGGTRSFSLLPGGSSSTTLTASGNTSGAITWAVGSVTPSANINVSYTAQGSNSAVISIAVGQGVSAGTYSVTVSAKDSVGTSSSATLNITVNAPQTNTDPSKDIPITDPSKDIPITDPSKDIPSKDPETNLTNKIAIRDESGATTNALPFSSLEAGASAIYTISLQGTGITAQSWRLLVNGVAVDSAMYAAEDSWARIVSSDAYSATIEADPPSNLNADSQISLSITGTDNKEYTADLGTVKKADEGRIMGVPNSNGGCNSGLGAVMLAAIFFTRRKKAHK